MTNKTLPLNDALYEYILAVSLREQPLLKQLREETANDEMAIMQISPEQGQFMALLVKLMNAKRVLEIGVFTGYSALSVALALPEDGEIVACDISKKWTDVARKYWQLAEVDKKITLYLAPAIDTLDTLISAGQQDNFDFVFIDADKQNYQEYYERSLKLIRVGGLIVVDNVLWSGAVIDGDINDQDTVAIREFNNKIHNDERVFCSLLPVGDGLTLLLKQ